MNSNLKNGLFGIVLASGILSGTVVAQFPLPAIEAPVPDIAGQIPELDDPMPNFAAPAQATESQMSEPVTQIRAIAAPAPAFNKPAPIDEPIQLTDSIPSSSDLSDSKPTAAELRQARAQYRSQQRALRLERNLWAGYEPLRPNWNSIPMMSSRYKSHNTFVVPLYYYPR